MYHYKVYGRCLASGIELQELEPDTSTNPSWSFSTVPSFPPMVDATELGRERIYADVHARLFSHSEGHRIEVDDTGNFDISSDRRILRWEVKDSAWPDFVRAHLLGRVLGTVLFLDGWLPLHGSAVALNGGVIGFLAPKKFGKTSLALALTAAGGELVTDDTLPVEPGEIPLAWPGVHSMRVNEDSAAVLKVGVSEEKTRDGKRVMTSFSDRRLSREPRPLKALYLLHPVAPEVRPLAQRVQLPPLIANVGVLSHVKIGEMLGKGIASMLMQRTADVLKSVPVYRLSLSRDLDQLPAAAEIIAAWH